MRQKAGKLLAKIFSSSAGTTECVNLIMKAFEDVAVSFAWEMLLGYKALKYVSIDQLKAGFRDYVTSLPFRPNYEEMDSYSQYDMMRRLSEYPPYKTQAEIVMDAMSKYCPKRYYKCAYCAHSFLDVGVKHCPKCESTHLYHITPAGYEKERAKNTVSYTCPDCHHTFLGKNWKEPTCPRCRNIRINLECGLDIQACRDREKFLNTYGYVARPGIDLDDGDPDKQTPSLCEQGFYSAQDVCDHTRRAKGLPVGYISYEDMDYLWKHMPEWIRKGPERKPEWVYPMLHSPAAYDADLEVHKEIKRILRRI